MRKKKQFGEFHNKLHKAIFEQAAAFTLALWFMLAAMLFWQSILTKDIFAFIGALMAASQYPALIKILSDGFGKVRLY